MNSSFNLRKNSKKISKIKIICTLGPTSFEKNKLNLLKKENIDIYRINLSHTKVNEITKRIFHLKKNKIKNICIDTEGAQIRTTHSKSKFFIGKGSTIIVSNKNEISGKKKINFYPEFNLLSLKIGTIIDIGFNNLSIKIIKKNILNKTLICKVLKVGYLESKKGVHIHSNIKLPPLTKKDVYALKIAKKMKIKHFAISFVNNHSDVDEVKKITGNKVFIISKIETKNALKNLKAIAKKSNALLIDRGDLSRYIPIEKIPLAQEYVVKLMNKMNKPTFIATNLLETMVYGGQPTRAESHDIYSTLKQGAKGLVLAAETAIGVNPVECVKFLKRCIKSYNNKSF